MKEKMNVKKNLVSFLAIASLLILTATVAAYTVTGDLADISEVEVNGLPASVSEDISIIAGETITVKIFFESSVNASDVRIKAEIEGEKQDVEAKTDFFDVEEDKRYIKTLKLRVPYELKDEKSEDLTLSLKIWNIDFRTEINDITLRVQRPTYSADIFAINTENVVKAGEIFPVEVVLKNRGYNNLDDLEVTVGIPALGIEKNAYFGDLVAIEPEDDDDEIDTVSGRIFLRIPNDVEPGEYILEVTVSNEDTFSSKIRTILIENEFPEQVIKVSEGLLFLNPTNNLKIYRVVFPSDDESLVTVQAGSSKTLDVVADTEDYVVNVLTMSGDIVGTFTFDGISPQVEGLRSPVIVLTVVLAIVFLVLLIVLIALLSKKPEKTEELGESYY